MERIVFAAAIALLAGCSWLTHGPARSPEVCNPSRFAPGYDAYSAATTGVLAVAMLGYASEGHSDGDTIGAVGVIAAGLAGLHGAAASYGFRHARACRALRAHAEPAPIFVVPAEPPTIEEEVVEEIETTRTQTRTRRIIRPSGR